MKTRTIGILLAAFLAAFVFVKSLPNKDVEILPLPDWSPDLGQQMHSVDMVRLGPDSLAVLWRTYFEDIDSRQVTHLVGRTCIVFGRPRGAAWTKPMTLVDAGGGGVYMVHAHDSLHVFLGLPMRHLVFAETDSFAEVADPRFEPQAHLTSEPSRRTVELRDGPRFIASLEREENPNPFVTAPRRLHVQRIEETRGKAIQKKLDVSKVRTRDGRLHGLALAEGDGFAYLLVADNPPILRPGDGSPPRRMRPVRLVLTAIR